MSQIDRYALITNTIVPLRAEPADESEIMTELLFGDTFRILDQKRQWRYIRADADGYEGWIDEKAYVLLSHAQHQRLQAETPVYLLDTVGELEWPGGYSQKLVKGCRLPRYDAATGNIEVGDMRMRVRGRVITGRHELYRVLEIAASYMYAPYLWGGKTDFGMDCSGLTQMAFRLAGYYDLPRNARDQIHEGELVDFDRRMPGDLAYFASKSGKITHVGIVWTDGLILHAHGQVHLDPLQVDGIFSRKFQRLSHHLVAIKRLKPKSIISMFEKNA